MNQNNQQKTTLGMIGTIFGILGLFLYGFWFGLVALICGIIEEPKSTFAKVAIVLGVVDIVGILLIVMSY